MVLFMGICGHKLSLNKNGVAEGQLNFMTHSMKEILGKIGVINLLSSFAELINWCVWWVNLREGEMKRNVQFE